MNADEYAVLLTPPGDRAAYELLAARLIKEAPPHDQATPPQHPLRHVPARPATQPRLVAKVGPLRAGDQAAEPATASTPESAAGQPLAADAPTDSEPQQPATRSQRGRGPRPAPEAASAVATTVRWDLEEAAALDRWILDLHADAHRTRLDKSEVLRELVRLAQEHEPTRLALLKRL
ncbi:hypothetical protein Kpho02_72650 [Kitasatospora phosalacinea]|uniref:Uncharacterized protein n=2 Tax=Kitasatospora phosalacinea TaxID=2065 RepID=A0A9W6QHC7_9ACTN|nr:hypothetical protein Kpho02_72650 [Kitasatospora phosalacinea]